MKKLLQWLTLCLLAGLALQLFFVLRIASMAVLAPESTSFERSQMWQIVQRKGQLPWRQEWVALSGISKNLQRAVLSSEDDAFASHGGIRWDAVKSAWDKNTKAQARAERQASQRPGRADSAKRSVANRNGGRPSRPQRMTTKLVPHTATTARASSKCEVGTGWCVARGASSVERAV